MLFFTALPLLLPFDSFGGLRSSLCALGDVDGDGACDFAVASQSGDECVWIVSGRTGDRIHEILASAVGAGPLDNFGRSLSAAGDVDGDGVPDLVIGACQDTEWVERTPGFVVVVSGATGEVLRRVQGEKGVELFGFEVSGGHDLDGDGVDDFAVGAHGNHDQGSVSVFSGKSGNRLHKIDMARLWELRPDSPGSAKHEHDLGVVLALSADLTGDDRADLVVGTSLYDQKSYRIDVFSGPSLEHATMVFGEDSDTAPWDVVPMPAGRGGPGLLVSGEPQWVRYHFLMEDRPQSPKRRLVHIDHGGHVLRGFGSSLGDMGDLDGDGVHDLVVGGNETWAAMFDPGVVRVYSTATKGLLWDYRPQDTFHDGLDVCALADVDGDGLRDCVIRHRDAERLVLVRGGPFTESWETTLSALRVSEGE